jgi:hypothetical protein
MGMKLMLKLRYGTGFQVQLSLKLGTPSEISVYEKENNKTKQFL